jgi:hypothetical protein
MIITEKNVKEFISQDPIKISNLIKKNGTAKFRKSIEQQLNDIHHRWFKNELKYDMPFIEKLRDTLRLVRETRLSRFKRSTAEKKLAELLIRVEKMNEDDGYLCRVDEMYLFGSMLGDSDYVGDVDIIVIFNRKGDMKDPKFKKKWETQQKECNSTGFIDRMCFPETKCWRYLKSRTSCISLHDDGDIRLDCEKKLIFKRS